MSIDSRTAPWTDGTAASALAFWKATANLPGPQRGRSQALRTALASLLSASPGAGVLPAHSLDTKALADAFREAHPDRSANTVRSYAANARKALDTYARFLADPDRWNWTALLAVAPAAQEAEDAPPAPQPPVPAQQAAPAPARARRTAASTSPFRAPAAPAHSAPARVEPAAGTFPGAADDPAPARRSVPRPQTGEAAVHAELTLPGGRSVSLHAPGDLTEAEARASSALLALHLPGLFAAPAPGPAPAPAPRRDPTEGWTLVYCPEQEPGTVRCAQISGPDFFTALVDHLRAQHVTKANLADDDLIDHWFASEVFAVQVFTGHHYPQDAGRVLRED